MDIFSKLLNEVKIPKFVKINYTIKQSKIEDPAYEVKRVINERNIFNEIKKGDSVCIACGSREISNLAIIVKSIVEEVKNKVVYHLLFRQWEAMVVQKLKDKRRFY